MSVDPKPGPAARDGEGGGEEGFLSRWSRRKEQARQGEVEEPVGAEPEGAAVAGDDGRPEEELTDAELLEKYELPDPDGMAAGDDFSAFMRDGVPARLRNRALRKLWLTNPALANLDELVDYGEDFTDAATVVENLQTLYQVGRGLVLPEEDKEDGEADAEDSSETQAAAASVETPDSPEKSSEETFDQSEGADQSTGDSPPQLTRSEPEEAQSGAAPGTVNLPETAEPGRRPRRMAFKFD